MQKLKLSKVLNARDLGGSPAADGRRIKPGLLIRSDALTELNEEDIHILCKERRLKTVIDLRTLTEKEERPDAELESVENLLIPIFPEEIVGISRGRKTSDSLADNVMPDMRNTYRLMVRDAAAVGQFKKVLRLIMQPRGGAVLWHCTAGKDRCGMTSALIERILGMDMELIREDYILTNEAAIPVADSFYASILDMTGSEAQAAAVRKLFVADMEYFDAAMDEMAHLYGGIDGFIGRGLGISPAEADEFRSRILA